MSRICYFKVHGATGLALAADLTTLEGVVDSKATATNVYTKAAADALLADKLVAADIAGKVDSSYLEQVVSDVNDSLYLKAQANEVYTKIQADALLDDKADASALASKLDTSVHDARVTAENLFYVAMGESLYLESAVGSGTEFSCSGLTGV